METQINVQPPTILVLTEFSNRDRNAADAALKLALSTKANLLLFNCYPILFSGYSDPHHEDDEAFISNIQTQFEKEKLRLENLMPEGKGERFHPNIAYTIKFGMLCDNVKDIMQQENITMVVMGGRPVKGNDLLFCTEINEILDKVNRPVLVVPENQPLHI